MMERVIIVGGVAGGATAAARLRRLKEDIEIIVLEKGEYGCQHFALRCRSIIL